MEVIKLNRNSKFIIVLEGANEQEISKQSKIFKELNCNKLILTNRFPSGIIEFED